MDKALEFKVVVLGDKGVGKTCLVLRFIEVNDYNHFLDFIFFNLLNRCMNKGLLCSQTTKYNWGILSNKKNYFA